MPQEIVIDIDADGEVTIDATKSQLGPECEKFTAEIEQAIGVVKERIRTPEFAQRRAAHARKQTA